MLVLQFFLAACLICSWLYWILCVYSARCWTIYASRSNLQPSTINHQPSTILKPLRGTDPEQYENFRSFCQQDYPEYQIVFGSLDPDDVGLASARRLME